jgi:NitT/TauT family transport system substrate-binding protein
MFNFDMSAPEMKEIGIGDVVDARLERNVHIIAQANNLPRLPAPSEVFDRSFLPPLAERPKQM